MQKVNKVHYYKHTVVLLLLLGDIEGPVWTGLGDLECSKGELGLFVDGVERIRLMTLGANRVIA